VAVLVAGVVGWKVLGGGGGGGGQGDAGDHGGSSTVATLPTKELLVTRANVDGTSDLLAVNTYSSAARVLVAGQHVSDPNISQDRTWMVFLEGNQAPFVPMLARPDGSSQRPLVADPPADCVGTGRPAWSPDGGHLAVVCLDADNHPTSLRTVTLDGRLEDPLVVSNQLRESVTWTGDDTVVYGRTDEPHGPVTLMEVAADGSAPPKELLAADGYWVSQLDWSDGGLLFIRASKFREPGDVWLLDPDGGLTEYGSEGGVISVSWSPDGQGAVYTTGPDLGAADQVLWVQDNSDATPRQLVTGPLGSPTWSTR
jgi:dipeptidyl aminopeptidase/acylaminoacyl peptidase